MKRFAPVLALLLLGCPGPPAHAPGSTLIPGQGSDRSETRATDAGLTELRAPGRLELGLSAEFSCLRIDRKVFCWKLGEPVKPISTIRPVSGVDDAIAIAVGSGHACAIGSDGRTRCWGDNHHGELGARLADEKRETPVVTIGVEGATAIASGGATTCAIVSGGAVMCWGDNSYGQTGSDVDYTEETNDLVVATRVPNISGATRIAVNGAASCALTPSGVWCWGESELESEKTARGKQSPEPSKLEEIHGARTLTGGHSVLCALGAEQISCWGGHAPQLAAEAFRRDGLCVTFDIAKGLAVATSSSHACAVVPGGKVSCFGADFNGTLGRGVLEESLEPKPVGTVEGVARVRSLALSEQTTCALTEDDQLWCWGLLPIGPNDMSNLTAEPVRLAVW